ncbi:CoA transferase [Halobacteriovorax sp. HLS]|uniref:CoA transferase n=1 Tax=Halobacteriovorax sp. HLS TaxID=2234000 RepID=UPI000FD84F2C|nr:CoA transferase [Halobacteriovorax sp. HLS]
MTQLLSGLTILDFSHRLPGPLASKLLAGLGANVLKVEDIKFKDPFIYGAFAKFDDSFPHWYEELNSNKQIIRLDFNATDIKLKIKELLENCDAVILGLPEKLLNKLGLNQQDLSSCTKPLAVIELLASKEHTKAMHDLNALALTGLLKLHVQDQSAPIVAPPFLPIAGIGFGHKVATDLLAALLKTSRSGCHTFHKCYLFESTKEIFESFWPKKSQARQKFLHNGLYPCYNLYQTKDKRYIALAAVEEKFWIRFCEIFKLNIESDKRFFYEDQSIFLEVASHIAHYDYEEIAEMTKGEEICLSLV